MHPNSRNLRTGGVFLESVPLFWWVFCRDNQKPKTEAFLWGSDPKKKPSPPVSMTGGGGAGLRGHPGLNTSVGQSSGACSGVPPGGMQGCRAL